MITDEFFKKSFINLLIIFLLYSVSVAMDLKLQVDLRGEWRFEIGDKPDYAKPSFNDSDWEKIMVPAAWENEGFPGYNGYGWYRIHFIVPNDLKGKILYLKLERIDDVDETYLNGKLIGSTGKFPPNYKTAYDDKRIYAIPQNVLKFGKENVLAVKVYDGGGPGGIVGKEVGIYSRVDVINLKIYLNGNWRFKTGDNPKYADPNYDDSQWKLILVPSIWEKQGYPKYDGIAWYRREVIIPDKLKSAKLILMLGKINDIDEVYFNGVLIGSTGEFPKKGKKSKYKGYYKEERAYFIPPSLIHFGKKNVIAVRVMDVGNKGGIYEGYIGITTRGEYLLYSKRKD